MSMVSVFKGLNNVTDPLRLGLAWLVEATNVDITDSGAIQKRTGYTKTMAGSFTSAYATQDFSRLFVVDGGTLKAMTGPAAAVSLLEGLSAAPMHFAEVNDRVFFSNGIDSGIIEPDNEVTPWRDSPLADLPFLDAAGNELESLLSPLPLGVGIIQHWRGRMYAAQYFHTENQTVIWFSQPLGFHLFSLDTDFFMVPGRVLMLAPHGEALLVGTDQQVLAYTGESLSELAPYGVVPGQHWAADGARILFWSLRGLCAALPFANLTDKQISVAPGVHAGGALVRSHGARRYLVSLQAGGLPFNPL